MPAPASIICCESVSRDFATGLVSYMNVVEAVAVQRMAVQPGQPPPAGQPVVINIVSKWMREDGDAPDTVFEVENILKMPNAPDLVAGHAEIKLGSPFHLVVSRVRLGSVPDVGVFYAESRIRRRGEQEWLARQQYPLIAKEEVPGAGVQPLAPGESSASQQGTAEPSSN